MTRTVSKSAALAAVILIGTLALPTSAEAGRYHRHHGGSAAAAGLIGLAIGAVIGGAVARDRHYGYYEDPYYYGPGPASYRPAPWTPEWYSYCHSKYRSFDRRSGTYQPYRGPRRFCR